MTGLGLKMLVVHISIIMDLKKERKKMGNVRNPDTKQKMLTKFP